MLSSPQIIHWIDELVEKRITALPDSTATFDLQIMDTQEALKNKIFQLDEQEGLSRILSTFDYVHKKDGAEYLVDPEGSIYHGIPAIQKSLGQSVQIRLEKSDRFIRFKDLI